MYEELQRKTRPKAPRCVLADGIKGLLGIVSPSKKQERKLRKGTDRKSVV